MSPGPHPLEQRVRRWLQARLANRIGFSLVSTTLLFTTLVALASFLYVAYLTQENQFERVREIQTKAAERLSFTFGAMADDLHTLASNPQIISGVLDSQGQEAYLQPLLQHFRPEGRTARALCLSNYKGETVGCNTFPYPDFSQEAWLKTVLQQGRPHARISASMPHARLQLVYPVIYEATGKPEGALIAEYDLTALLEQLGRQLPPRYQWQLDAAGPQTLVRLGRSHDPLLLRQPLKLPLPLQSLGLELGIGENRHSLLAPLLPIALVYLLLGGLLVWAAWTVSRRIAGALAQRLSNVTEQAEAVARTGTLSYGLIQDGHDEVARLSQAFSAMTDRIREINQNLELRVNERTAELAQANRQLEQEIVEKELAQQALEQHQRELEATVHARTAELTALTTYIDRVREEEKAAIARELHDEFGGILTAIKMGLAKLASQEIATRSLYQIPIQELASRTDHAIATMRRILDTLRPSVLDHLGIGAAIQWQTREFTRQTGIPCEVVLFDDDIRLDNALSLTLFRVLQESLTNVMRHAKASRVTVSLSRNDAELTLEVIDDGIGLQASPERTHGIRGMKERARRLDGKLLIASGPAQGTHVELTLPLPD